MTFVLLPVTDYFLVVKCEILNAEFQQFMVYAPVHWGGGGEVWTE
jgi:hypothetical protein